MQSTVCPDTQSDKNKIVLIISFNMLRRAVCDLLIEKEKWFFIRAEGKQKTPPVRKGLLRLTVTRTVHIRKKSASRPVNKTMG